jgi:perosamine synthetase
MKNKITIPVYKPFLPPNVRKYVNDCINSTWISSKGKYVEKFENKFCDFLNLPYAASVSNGTVALHVALLSLDIGKGDEVIVPDLTYIASINSIAYVGAKPVLVDSQKNTWNIDTDKIEERITRKTKAIMAVHLFGNPCNMEKLRDICNRNNLYLIEDAAEAFGSKYQDSYCGSFGDVSTFSFFGNKTITTGEGGMVVTKDAKLNEKVKLLKNQYVSPNKEYWHDEIGFNYRMTNIQASIGLAQLEQAQLTLDTKIRLAENYKEALANYPVNFQMTEDNSINSYWMVSITVENELIRDGLRKTLFQNGIETRPFFYPASKMPVFTSSKINPESSSLSKKGISLPSFPTLSSDDFKYIIKIISYYFDNKKMY